MPKPTADKPNVAVVSSNGVEIDTHLGQAQQVLVYGPREDGLACLLEVRNAPAPGSGSARWNRLAMILRDCFVLLAAQAGDTPRRILSENNISVMISDDHIEGIVDVFYGGGKKKNKRKK
jgi:nitrogen fixation protein NifB